VGGGDGESSNDNNDTSNTSNNDSNDSNVSTASSIPKFNLTGAVALVANDQVVKKTTSSARSSRDGSPLFTYEIYHDSDQKTRGVRATGDTEGATNLWAIDANGNATSALDTNYPVKVMYSAVNPAGDKVYLALDNGWFGSDGNDYQTFIARNNCALYEVTPADNTFKCAVEGVFLQNYDDDYYKRVSSNQKPIQFDKDGNVYFLGTSFTVQNDGGYCFGDNYDALTGDINEYNDQGQVIGCSAEAISAGFEFFENVWIDSASWNPTLYKYNPSTAKADAMTQDNEGVQYFSTLTSGDIVIQGWNDNTQKQTFAVLNTLGARINLLETDWGLEFFTTDSESTVIFSDWTDSAGLRMVKPISPGVHKTVLGLDKFAVNNAGSYQNPTPRRVILADDGKLYGVFESWSSYQDKNDKWVSNTTLTVYQVLPYDPVPKAQLNLGSNDWWSFMEGTPFQISRGFLFYRQKESNIAIGGVSLGSADTIVMVNLQTREKKVMLMPQTATDGRYEIFSWRLSGTELYFSALNNTVNKVVTGKIDTVKVRVDADESTYLTVNETASAIGATAKIQDIAVLKATRPENDPGGSPKAEFFANSENPNSVTIEFTKYMNNQSVLDNLTFKNTTDNEVIAYLPLWINKTLHLIPDSDGLTNSTGAGMENNKTYQVSLGTGINDYYSTPIDQTTLSKTLSTAPDKGWYIGDTDATTAALSDKKVAKFVGRDNPNTWGHQYYKIADNLPAHFELKFSAKNLNYSLGTVAVHESTASYRWDGLILENFIDSWSSWLDYKDASDNGQWDSYNSDGKVVPYASGNWANYRFRFVGNTYQFAVSTDGSEYTEIHKLTNVKTPTAAELYLAVNEKLYIDNMQLTTLKSDGTVNTSAGDLIDEKFESTLPTASPNLNAKSSDLIAN